MNISFIVPAYNEEALLPRCIKSIQYEVSRHSYVKEYEIIVVDNNSTDNTRSVAESLGVTVITCLDKGVTNSRQAGFKAAEYELQAYIDADNFLPVNWLSSIYLLNADEKLAAISGPLKYTNQTYVINLGTKLFYYLNMMATHLIGPTIQGGNFILKKSALEKVGGHSTNISFYGEDTDLAVRLSKVGKIKLVPRMWIHSSPRRLEGQGTFNTSWIYIINYLSINILGKPWTLDYKDFRPDE